MSGLDCAQASTLSAHSTVLRIRRILTLFSNANSWAMLRCSEVRGLHFNDPFLLR
jgi:hypothetical protein